MKKIIVAMVLVSAAACSGGNPGPEGADGLLGEAQLAIVSAPPDASCLRVVVSGSRSVTRLFDLMPMQSTVFALQGLPLGVDTFTGDAFATPCGQVDPTSAPTWSSAPVVTTLQAGVVASVTLVFHRNGQATVTADFEDDQACFADGQACAVDSQCCSHGCNGGVCGNPCAGGAMRCTDASGVSVCADIGDDPENCGGCGVHCVPMAGMSGRCINGTCLGSCLPGFADCDGSPANGCETILASDPANCGSCGAACPPGFGCSDGACN